ncbi:MAG: cupin domain-containing protein [Alphaproteobacteria bacterium]
MAMPVVLDSEIIPARKGSDYPEPFRNQVSAREKRALGDTVGIRNYGVNLVRIPPGCPSTMRHWHTLEDEFVYILEGSLVLITDEGEQTLTPGMIAGFPAGKANGHQLLNRTDKDALYIEIGDRRLGDEVEYPDIDMVCRWVDGEQIYAHKNGKPYPRDDR